MPGFLKYPLLLITTALLLSACATVRQATYPRDFVYLEQAEITSDMQAMAVQIDRLDRLLADSSTPEADRQDRVVAALSEINRIASALGAGPGGGNHALIDNNIDDLQQLALTALTAAESDPPIYYPAGRLAGQCLACHVQR